MNGETFNWTVRSYECAPDGKVTIANVCNYLQEAASLNADALTLELAFKSEVLAGTTVRVETVRQDGVLYQRIRSDADHVLAKRSN